MRKFYRFVPLLIILLLIIAAIKFGLSHYLNYASLKHYHLELEAYVNEHYFLALLLFSLSYILIVVTSIPGATFLTLLGGLLFGSIMGTIVVVLAATAGATMLVTAIKLAFGEAVSKRIGAKVKFMENNFKQNAFFYLLSLRLLPIVPFFLINLACGIFNIRLSTFIPATLIGIIPGTFVYVNIGASLNSLFQQSGNTFKASAFITPSILIAFVLLAILSILPVILKKIRPGNNNGK